MLNPQCGYFLFRRSHDAETVMAESLADKLQFTKCALPIFCRHFVRRTATFFRQSRPLSDLRKLRRYNHLFICRTLQVSHAMSDSRKQKWAKPSRCAVTTGSALFSFFRRLAFRNDQKNPTGDHKIRSDVDPKQDRLGRAIYGKNSVCTNRSAASYLGNSKQRERHRKSAQRETRPSCHLFRNGRMRLFHFCRTV